MGAQTVVPSLSMQVRSPYLPAEIAGLGPRPNKSRGCARLRGGIIGIVLSIGRSALPFSCLRHDASALRENVGAGVRRRSYGL